MSFQKNVTGQRWMVFAFDRTTNVPLTGDAANITARIRKDYAAAAATNDVNPTEIEDGYYEFTLTQAETNADVVDLFPESSTGDIQVIGVPGRSFTTYAAFNTSVAQTANHTSNIAAILVDTAELQTDWVDGGRLDTILDAAGSAGDPWLTPLPASYAAGTAGYLLNDIKTDAVTTLSYFTGAGTAGVLLPSSVPSGDVKATVGVGSTTTSIVSRAFSPYGVYENQFATAIVTFTATTITVALRNETTTISASTASPLPVLTVATLPAAPVAGDDFVIDIIEV